MTFDQLARELRGIAEIGIVNIRHDAEILRAAADVIGSIKWDRIKTFIVHREVREMNGNGNQNDTRITVGTSRLWTSPWGNGKALISANGKSEKEFLYRAFARHPEHFETLVNTREFCEEDLEGTFSVIVDPEEVVLEIVPGSGLMQLRLIARDDDDD